jgi:hypothetical protein
LPSGVKADIEETLTYRNRMRAEATDDEATMAKFCGPIEKSRAQGRENVHAASNGLR